MKYIILIMLIIFITSPAYAVKMSPGVDLTGTIIIQTIGNCPQGTLDANGAAVSRTTYAKLFNKIGTTWGSGDGSTTFNLPDLRGAFLRGTGSQTYNSETYTGPSVGSKQNDATSKNGLDLNDSGHAHYIKGYSATGMSSGSGGFELNTGGVNYYGTQSSTTGITITNGDSETRPFSVGVKYCIVY